MLTGDEQALQNGIERIYALIRAGSPGEALQIGRTLLSRFPDDARSWNVMCEILREGGAFVDAARHAARAATLMPAIPNYHVQYGRCLAMAGHRAGAIAAADRAAALNPEGATLLDALGSIYALADEQQRALGFFERACAAAPGEPAFRYNLASCLRTLGRTEEAESACEAVIALDPGHCDAFYVRSDLRTWTAENNHVAALEALLARGGHDRRGEILLRFALAKELEDIGEHDRSFAARKAACDLQRASIDYDVEEDIRVIDRIIALHDRKAIDGAMARGACDNDEPIFVLGMPRSGTTLVERILSRHSRVQAAGELNEFAFALLRAAADAPDGRPDSKEALVEASLSLDMERLGRTYVESTRPRTGHAPHFVDKMPLNYLYCGLIKAALPKARIILLDRDPMDLCYAVYKTLFSAPYPFSYDLEELGRYYLAWRRLADHWRATLGEDLLVMRYEDIVTDQEGQSRRLIAHCGLDWEAACLDFHKGEAPSSTASAVQVRRPIYSSSIGRWRRYARQLQPLVDLFEDNGLPVR